MRKAAANFRAPILVLWTVLLSALTAVFGATPLRVLRQTTGCALYWVVGFAIVSFAVLAGWYPLAFIVGVHVLLIGTFAEFEEREFTLRQSASFAILLTTLFLSSSFYVWTAVAGRGWLSQLLSGVDVFLSRAKELNLGMVAELKAQDIVSQIPSAVLIFIILSLGLALIFEPKVSRWVGVKMGTREKLTDFSAPDFVIWLFIGSLLGAFGQLGVKSLELVSVNVLNVTVVIYFFQGLAVLGKYFEAFKISSIWRLLWVMILVVQLPILMSLLGLVDYWADFRKAFVKKAAELRKKRIQD